MTSSRLSSTSLTASSVTRLELWRTKAGPWLQSLHATFGVGAVLSPIILGEKCSTPIAVLVLRSLTQGLMCRCLGVEDSLPGVLRGEAFDRKVHPAGRRAPRTDVALCGRAGGGAAAPGHAGLVDGCREAAQVLARCEQAPLL
jgi:hypothetical protein